jgi:uncharacterized membrane protein HdeD (DUF308 family)
MVLALSVSWPQVLLTNTIDLVASFVIYVSPYVGYWQLWHEPDGGEMRGEI